MILLVVLALWVLCAAYAPQGIEPNAESKRQHFIQRIGLVILAVASPNPWIGALMILPLITVQPVKFRPQEEQVFWTIFMWAGLYVAIAYHVTIDWLPWLLGMMLTVGVLQGLWCIHSLVVKERPYTRPYRLGLLEYTIWEPPNVGQPVCGCSHPNHTHAISAMATAAGIGLMMLASAWFLPLVLLASLAMVRAVLWGDEAKQINASHVYSFVICLGMAITGPGIAYSAISLGILLAAGIVLWFRPHRPGPGVLSGRLVVWEWLFQHYWRSPWGERIVGKGSGAWTFHTMKLKPFKPVVWTNPHSDVLLLLYEHGWVGVGLLAGYVGTSLWTIAHADTAGIAVLLVGAVIGAASLNTSPWSPYVLIVRVDPMGRPVGATGQGSPLLNVLTFLTILSLEALT
jgi:hypothetical protein